MKPVPRSRVRVLLGVCWYRLRRSVQWHFGSAVYAMRRESGSLPHVCFNHRTPLYRSLRNVDLWLQRNKVTNLAIAIRRLNGVVVQPGETLSYWRLIGKPTKRKGYLPGMVLFYGTFRAGTGGGLCQLSNLLYWMTLHTPLRVTERHRHSYDVFPDAARTQPFGSGATCYYNYLDLQIYNPTKQPYELQLWLTESELAGEWRCDEPPLHQYEVYERDHSIQLEHWGRYTRCNSIWRRSWSRYGELASDEWIADNRALMMYEPLLTPGDGGRYRKQPDKQPADDHAQ